jgi:hypothetical protein
MVNISVQQRPERNLGHERRLWHDGGDDPITSAVTLSFDASSLWANQSLWGAQSLCIFVYSLRRRLR